MFYGEFLMTKKQLALYISERDSVSQVEAIRMIDIVASSIRETLELGEDITLRGFGNFKVIQTAPRSGRNLHTQERVIIPSKSRVRFHSYMNEEEVSE